MKNLSITFCILLFTCIACNQKKSNTFSKEGKVIDVRNIIQDIDIEQVFESRQFIPLETSVDCIVGKIQKIIELDSLFYILDVSQNSVFLFNENGFFIDKYASRGKGPGEYIEINDINLGKNGLILLVNSNKLIYLSRKLEYMNEELLNFYSSKFAYIDETLMAFYTDHFKNSNVCSDSNCQLIIKNGTKKQCYFPSTLSKKAGFSPPSTFYFSNKLIFHYPLNYTSYEFSGDEFLPGYYFNFHENSFDYESLLDLSQREILKTVFDKNDKVTFINNIYDFGDRLYFWIILKNKDYLGFCDRESNKGFLVKEILDNRFGLPLGNIVGSFEDGVISEILPYQFAFDTTIVVPQNLKSIVASDNSILVKNYAKRKN